MMTRPLAHPAPDFYFFGIGIHPHRSHSAHSGPLQNEGSLVSRQLKAVLTASIFRPTWPCALVVANHQHLVLGLH